MIRLVLAAATPLFPDETYYWDWSRRLAAGYFDHPPAIAWAVKAGTLLFGATPLGVRLGPVVLGTLAGLALVAAANRLAGARAAMTAAIVFSAMPLAAAGLVLATPDAPLFAAAAFVVYAFVRATEAAPGSAASLRWWSVAGVALGLAVTSKYTAVLLPLGILTGLLLQRDGRRHISSPGPWIATALALIVFSPVILWNANQDWASFRFQLQHGLGAVGGSVLKRELDLLGGQAGLVTPILFVMMIVAAARARGWRERALGVAATVIFVFFMYSATKRRAEANWPALAYIPGMLLLAAHEGGTRWRRWMRAGVVLAVIATVITYVNTITPILPVPARRDPVARASGWDDLATAVDQARGVAETSGGRIWVAGDRYQEASELAFHLKDRPQTFSLNLTSRPNHYDLWPGFDDIARPGDGMVLAVDEHQELHPTVDLLRGHFDIIQPAAMVTLSRDGDPVKHLQLWVLRGWRGTWPEPPLRSPP